MSKIDFTLNTSPTDFRGAAVIGANGAQMLVSGLKGLAQNAKDYGDTVTEKNTQELLGILNQAKTPEEVENAAANIMNIANERFAGNVKLPVLNEAIDQRPTTLMQRGVQQGQFNEFKAAEADKPILGGIYQDVIGGDSASAASKIGMLQSSASQKTATELTLGQRNKIDDRNVEILKAEATANTPAARTNDTGTGGRATRPLTGQSLLYASTPQKVVAIDASGNLVEMSLPTRSISGVNPTIEFLMSKGAEFGQEEVEYMNVLSSQLNNAGIDFNPTTYQTFEQIRSIAPDATAADVKLMIDAVANGQSNLSVGQVLNVNSNAPIAKMQVGQLLNQTIASTRINLNGEADGTTFKGGVERNKFSEWQSQARIAMLGVSGANEGQSPETIIKERTAFNNSLAASNDNIRNGAAMFLSGLKGDSINYGILNEVIKGATLESKGWRPNTSEGEVKDRLDQSYKALLEANARKMQERTANVVNVQTEKLRGLIEQAGGDPSKVTVEMVEGILNGTLKIQDAAASGVQRAGNEDFKPSTSRNVNAYNSLIGAAASKYNLDAGILKAIMHTESSFNPNARSPVGAQGLMQLMPKTAEGLGVSNSFDPAQNIEGGAKYYRYLLDKYDGDVSIALAAYNAGEVAVDNAGRKIPPFRETRDFVRIVMGRYKALYANNPLAADVRYENGASPQEGTAATGKTPQASDPAVTAVAKAAADDAARRISITAARAEQRRRAADPIAAREAAAQEIAARKAAREAKVSNETQENRVANNSERAERITRERARIAELNKINGARTGGRQSSAAAVRPAQSLTQKYGEDAITADNPEALAEEIRRLGAAGRARMAAQAKEADSKRAITSDDPEALAREIRRLGAEARIRLAAQAKEADSKRAITSDDPEALAAAIARISALSRERRKQGNNK